MTDPDPTWQEAEALTRSGRQHYGAEIFDFMKPDIQRFVIALKRGTVPGEYSLYDIFWGSCDLAKQMMELETDNNPEADDVGNR